MTGQPLTPEREALYRKWAARPQSRFPLCGKRLLAALDAARAEADTWKARHGMLQEMYRKCSAEREAVEAEADTLREALMFYAARPDEHDNKAAREALHRIGEQ